MSSHAATAAVWVARQDAISESRKSQIGTDSLALASGATASASAKWACIAGRIISTDGSTDGSDVMEALILSDYRADAGSGRFDSGASSMLE
jgi:hypothetical protein